MTGQTGDSELPGAVRLTMRPESDFYGPSDDRLEAEMFELQTAISQEFPDALKAKPVPGVKGPALDTGDDPGVERRSHSALRRAQDLAQQATAEPHGQPRVRNHEQ